MYITATNHDKKSYQHFGMSNPKTKVKTLIKLSDDVFLAGLPEINSTQNVRGAKKLFKRIAKFKNPEEVFKKLFTEGKKFNIDNKKTFSAFANAASETDSTQLFFKSFYADGELPKKHLSTFLNQLSEDKGSLNEFINFIETKKPDLRIAQTQADFVKLAEQNVKFRNHMLKNKELYFPTKESKTIEFKNWEFKLASTKDTKTIERLKELSKTEANNLLEHIGKTFYSGAYPTNIGYVSAFYNEGTRLREAQDGIKLSDQYKNYLDNFLDLAKDYNEPEIVNKLVSMSKMHEKDNGITKFAKEETIKYLELKTPFSKA